MLEGQTIHVDDLVDGYVDVVHRVASIGQHVEPRGVGTLEVLGATIVVDDPEMCLPIGVGRGVSKEVAAVEALQLIGGFSDPGLTIRASDNFRQVRDGGVFHGAYGPRCAAQFPRVIDRLKDDRYSRRAVVTIWDPVSDLFRDDLHDYPCTMTLEYMIRNDKLVALTHMRSNDVWLGLAYDGFVFTQVQLTLCYILGIEPGVYIHNTSSLHLYESDEHKIEDLHSHRRDQQPELPLGIPSLSWIDAQMTARAAAYTPSDAYGSESVTWYDMVMRGLHARD
jgi:thymidylate synthase